MRVLVAGDGGYIGAVLVPFLQRAGHEVHGLDLGLYAGCDLGPAQGGARSPGFVDMRDVTAAQLTGYDAVPRLAALSNDPLGDLNPAATYSVSEDGTMNRPAWPRRWASRGSCSRPPQPLRLGLLGCGRRGRGPLSRHPVRREQGPKQNGDLALARGRQLQPYLPAERDRVRCVHAAALGHRGEQPHRRGVHDRPGSLGERRHTLAAARAHRGHQPDVPGRARGAA